MEPTYSSDLLRPASERCRRYRSLSTIKSRQSGSAIIEMALLFPLLVLMLCGTMDFARAFYAGIAVASAARAGVQFGALSPSNAGKLTSMNAAAVADASGQGLTTVTPVSRTYCTGAASTTEVSCTSATVCGTAVPSGYVETTVAYTFNTIVPYPGIPQSVVLTRVARLRVQ